MKISPLALALVVLGLAACSQADNGDEVAEAPLTMHEVMANQIDAHADELWDISNAALDDTAGIDPALLTEAQWDEMTMRAGEVESGARTLAAMQPIIVAAPGVKISDEGIENGHTAAQVQSFVDANPELFHDLADTLANHMAEIVAATTNRDAEALGPLVDQLDGVCESCHLQFWYPEQRELVERFQREGVTDGAQ